MPGPTDRHVLMIAYHFPPVKVSSGLQRTLKFATYLGEQGWTVSVLSAHPRAYDGTSNEQLGEIPAEVEVRRAFALDSSRHLAVAGRYPSWFALPDRWVGWVAGAVPTGLAMIRRHRPSVIWSTYPIASAHLIGLALHRATGIPWVADFRDSMTEEGYPADPKVRRCFQWIERRVARHCARAVFTTPGARRMYEARYPEYMPGKAEVIPNGYDEENFTRAEARIAGMPRGTDGRLTLVHSGVLYPSERDPTAFFDALARLRDRGSPAAKRLRVVLRATGHDAVHRPAIQSRGLGDVVELAPPVPYEQALAEMLAADGLLLFQASNCNHQIPAKVYEYFRSGRPVLALTDPAGDTARTLNEVGIDSVVPLDDAAAIAETLERFVDALDRHLPLPVASTEVMAAYSRRGLTSKLARVMEGAAGR